MKGLFLRHSLFILENCFDGCLVKSMHCPSLLLSVSSSKEKFARRLFLVSLGGVALAALLLYLGALNQYFVADDFIFLNQLRFKQPSVADNLVYFGRDWGLGAPFYRPLTRLAWAGEYGLFGLNAAGWHLSSALLYAANTGLVYILGWLLSRRNLVAIIASLLFAFHPAHSETVSWISNQSDLLVGFFCLAGVIFYIQARHTANNRPPRLLMFTYILALASFVLALFSKESSFGLLLVPLAYELLLGPFTKTPGSWRAPSSWLKIVAWQLPFLGVFLLYLGLRFIALGGFGGYGPDPDKINLPAGAFIESYVKWLLQPFDSAFLIPWLVVLVLLLLYNFFSEAWQMRQYQRADSPISATPVQIFPLSRMALFGLCWLFLFLIPTIGTPPSARFVYLPTVGLAILFASILTPNVAQFNSESMTWQKGRLFALHRVRWAKALLLVGLLVYSGQHTLTQQDAWYRAGQTVRSTLDQIHNTRPELVNYTYVYAVGLPEANESALIFRTGFPHAIQLVYDNPTIEAVSIPGFPVVEKRLTQTYFVEYRGGAIVARDDLVESLEKRNSDVKAKNERPFLSWDFSKPDTSEQRTDATLGSVDGWTLLSGRGAIEKTPNGLRVALPEGGVLRTPLFELPAPALAGLEITLRVAPSARATSATKVSVHWLVAGQGDTVERATSLLEVVADGLYHAYRVKPVDISNFLYYDTVREVRLDFPPGLDDINIEQATLYRLP